MIASRSLYTSFVLVTVLLLLLTMSLLPGFTNRTGASSGDRTGYKLTSIVSFNQYGQGRVNETLRQSHNSTGLDSVTFGFPQGYSGHIADIIAFSTVANSSSPANVFQRTQNSTLAMTVSPSSSVPSDSIGSISLSFYVVGLYSGVNQTAFSVPTVFYPSLSIPVDNKSVSLVFPYLESHVANASLTHPVAFSHTVATSSESWNNATSTLPNNLYWGRLIVSPVASDAGSLIFQNVTRLVYVDQSGEVGVQDTIKVQNLGLNTVSKLDLNLLTNQSSVTVVPFGEPPLSNIRQIAISGGVDLSSIGSIQPQSTITLVLQYPLAPQYWNFSRGVYHVTVPQSLPIQALLNLYEIKVQVPSGIITGQIPKAVEYSNSSSASGGNLSFTYRQGIASAFSSALPVALIIFIAVFVGGVVLRPRVLAKGDVESVFDELRRLVGEKVSGTNDIMQELKSKGSGVNRNDLNSARLRIEELRTRESTRFAEVRSGMTERGPGVQSALNQVVTNDRELDRLVRDLLNMYDQFVSRRMKADTFERVRSNSERRVQRISNDLLDSVQSVRRVYEA